MASSLDELRLAVVDDDGGRKLRCTDAEPDDLLVPAAEAVSAAFCLGARFGSESFGDERLRFFGCLLSLRRLLQRVVAVRLGRLGLRGLGLRGIEPPGLGLGLGLSLDRLALEGDVLLQKFADSAHWSGSCDSEAAEGLGEVVIGTGCDAAAGEQRLELFAPARDAERGLLR